MRPQTHVLGYVPPSLRSNSYVAGGFAVDPERASDIDIWITCLDPESIFKDIYKQQILDELNDGIEGTPDWKSIDPVDPYEIGGIKRLGTLWHRATRETDIPVQILVSTLDIMDVLKSFDLSVHQVAYDVDGTMYYSTTRTSPGISPIRVTRWDTPHSTLRRYFKLTERYQSAIEWADIEQLCSLAVSSTFKGKWPGKKVSQ